VNSKGFAGLTVSVFDRFAPRNSKGLLPVEVFYESSLSFEVSNKK
jgi:hypothetical protein